ncbi:MAG: ORF6N domain-containing protein [Candidatus Brocadiae bacterium]|nr:ORF6N domain-containing protein [Candidatus Brocadiia bacterium]
MATKLSIKEVQSYIINIPNRPPFMVDKDLAIIYGTQVKRINEAVKRNPKDFQ